MLHIDLPTRADIEALAAHRGAPAVSIYVATTPLTQETDVDRIELKNLLKAAVAEMEAGDTPKRAIWPIEQAVEELVDDHDFWASRPTASRSSRPPRASAPSGCRTSCSSLVEVSDRFHIKPLLRAVTFPQNAYVLAIGMGAVRLVEVDADLPPADVKVPGLPRDMADALGRRSHGARTGAGTSGEEQSEHALLTRYARAVDQALRPVLSGHGRPLIVAAAEPLASVYRAVSSYPHTAAEVIGGAADRTPDQELRPPRNVLDADLRSRGRRDRGALRSARAAGPGGSDSRRRRGRRPSARSTR